VAAVDCLKSFTLTAYQTILLADIGSTMLSGTKSEIEGIQSIRVRVLGDVMGAWLSRSAETSNVVIAFGGALDDQILAKAWAAHADHSKSEEEEFGDARELRAKNASLCKQLIHANCNSNSRRLLTVLGDADKTFSSEAISLTVDLLMGRTVAEVLVAELLIRWNVSSAGNNLCTDIENLAASKRVSPWITSYLHVLRLFGNEATHDKSTGIRRPERPMGGDLIVIHAALNRVLGFCCDYPGIAQK
jgi:hypothetical protein